MNDTYSDCYFCGGQVRQAQIKRALIVCPESAVGVWIDHLQRWSPDLFITGIRGTQAARQAGQEIRRLSYKELVRRFFSRLQRPARGNLQPARKG